MDENDRLQVALFRFSLIAPLVNGSLETSVRDYLEQVCAKRYDVPGRGSKEFTPRTLLTWRWLYQQHGLEGLKPKHRTDRGHFRRLDHDAQQFLTEAVRRNPRATATTLYEELAQAQLLGKPPCSLSTVQRFLRTVEGVEPPKADRRRFVFAYANACWQSDFCVGPYVVDPVRKRKLKTYLMAILDDASRLCVGAAVSLHGNYAAFEAVFKAALQKRGIPQRLYVDNGKLYYAQHLQVICAELGISLIHSTPYEPQGRGKIERYFRTVREQCFARLAPEDLTSPETLNTRVMAWIEQTYHRRPHSSLDGHTPMQRFLADQKHLRFLSEERIERAFLHLIERRVAKDATISVDRLLFEVPAAFIDRRVRIRMRQDDPTGAWIEQADGSLLPIAPLRAVDNAEAPRRRPDPIDYGKLMETEAN